MSRTNGRHRITLIESELLKPRGIAIHPVKGYLYWTDWSDRYHRIERSFLDGTDRQTIASKKIG